MAEWIQARRLIALQFYARLSPKDAHFYWPSLKSLLHIQDYLVEDLNLCNDVEADVPYKKSFLKQLISHLEKAVEVQTDSSEVVSIDLDSKKEKCFGFLRRLHRQEINGNVLELYANLMASGENPLLPPSRKVYYFYPPFHASREAEVKVEGIFTNWNCITLNEEASTIVRGTTGLKTWEASLRLAAHLVAQPEILSASKMQILELGSGVGLLGTVIAKQATQAEIHLTDLDGIVLDHLRETIDKNLSSSHTVTVSPLDWLDVPDNSTTSNHYLASLRPHVIIAADIVYDPELIEPLCKVLKLALTSTADEYPQPYALIASTVRNEQTYALFLRCISEQGLKATERTILTPKINLDVGTLVLDKSQSGNNSGYIDLFPSIHDPCKDGTVRLLHIAN